MKKLYKYAIAAIFMSLSCMAMSAADLTINPAPGDVSRAGNNPWDEIALMYVDNDGNPCSIAVPNASGAKLTVPAGAPAINITLEAYNEFAEWGIASLKVHMSPKPQYKGTYTLTLAAGTYTFAGVPNEAVTYTWNFLSGEDLPSGGTGDDQPTTPDQPGEPTTPDQPGIDDPETKVIEIASITPSTATPIEVLTEGTTFIVTFVDPTGIEYCEGRLDCVETVVEGNQFAMASFTKQENGSFAWTNRARNYPLFEGSTYLLQLDCYDSDDPNPLNRNLIGVATALYRGASPARFKVSDVKMLSIDPAPGSEIHTETVNVTVTFDAPVEFVSGYTTQGGVGSTSGGVTGVALNSEKTIWQLTPRYKGVDTALMVQFTDASGAYVMPYNSDIEGVTGNWNSSLEGQTYFEWHYDWPVFGAELNVYPAPGSTVSTLSTLDFTNPNSASLNEIRWSYNTAVWDIKVLDADGKVVSKGANVSGKDPENILITLDPVIKTKGTYTVEVPWKAFSLGSEYSAQHYKGGTYTYTVGGEQTGIENVEVETAATYYDLTGRKIVNSERGSVVIRVAGDKVIKQVIK